MYHWWRLRPNLPLDPAPAKPEHADPALCTVAVSITTPDTAFARGAVVTEHVHPEQLGDYLRAGWQRAEDVANAGFQRSALRRLLHTERAAGGVRSDEE